ncbi:hypothetical protein TNCV_3512871 [Trichonephila clavipes]|nr:hypothetical protein TNCV_3512871 [Trichonephila clavipes]
MDLVNLSHGQVKMTTPTLLNIFSQHLHHTSETGIFIDVKKVKIIRFWAVVKVFCTWKNGTAQNQLCGKCGALLAIDDRGEQSGCGDAVVLIDVKTTDFPDEPRG